MFDKKISEVMTTPVSCVGLQATLSEAARKMKDLDIGTVVVCDQSGTPMGVVTDRDITVRATAEGKDPAACRVTEVMSTDLVFCNEHDTTRMAEGLMESRQIRRLLVLDNDDKLCGIVALSDLVGVDRGMTGRIVEKVSQPSAGYAGH
jgi:CBS domain-containing protein